MANIISGYEDYAKGKPSLHKRFGGQEYFWCGKYKRKDHASHVAHVARNLGYRYRIEKVREVSVFTYEKVTRYNVWVRKV